MSLTGFALMICTDLAYTSEARFSVSGKLICHRITRGPLPSEVRLGVPREYQYDGVRIGGGGISVSFRLRNYTDETARIVPKVLQEIPGVKIRVTPDDGGYMVLKPHMEKLVTVNFDPRNPDEGGYPFQVDFWSDV